MTNSYSNKWQEFQLANRELIRTELLAAGWEDVSSESSTDIEMYLDMVYSNSTMTLELEYDPKKKRIYLAIYEIMGQRLDLIINYGNNLPEIIKLLVPFNRTLSVNNYQTCIKNLGSICEDIYADIDGKIYQLIDEDEKNTTVSENSSLLFSETKREPGVDFDLVKRDNQIEPAYDFDPDSLPDCPTCASYDGEFYDGEFYNNEYFHCAIHPYDFKDSYCPDWSPKTSKTLAVFTVKQPERIILRPHQGVFVEDRDLICFGMSRTEVREFFSDIEPDTFFKSQDSSHPIDGYFDNELQFSYSDDDTLSGIAFGPGLCEIIFYGKDIAHNCSYKDALTLFKFKDPNLLINQDNSAISRKFGIVLGRPIEDSVRDDLLICESVFIYRDIISIKLQELRPANARTESVKPS